MDTKYSNSNARFQSASICKTTKTKLLIDHDGGADDAMAIFMSLLYEKYFDGPEVVALTLTHGNVNESQVYINSQRILDKAGRRDVKIYRGATRALVMPMPFDFYFGTDGLGDNEYVELKEIRAQKEHAVFALIEFSKKYNGNDSTKPEFNAYMDVEAYQIVVDNTTTDKVTVIPFSQILTTLDFSNEWRKDVLGAIPTEIMEALNSYERISIASSDSWSNLDPAVAAIVLDEN
ncbi:putative inosine-uridine preferring nucleoside hydrolase, partial [Operophtera brumata]